MPLTWGYVAGAIMIFGGIVALIIGIDAERQSLEDIADPAERRPHVAPPGRRGPARRAPCE